VVDAASGIEPGSFGNEGTLRQHGHFGRPRFSVARSFDNAWHADWTIIVDPPRRSTPHPAIPILPAVCGATATPA
jgi:hypothetical protein